MPGARIRRSFLLLLPVVALIFSVSFGYVVDSWSRLEESREAGGMPGLFLLKTVILGFCVLLGLQGLALAGRSLLVLRRHPDFVAGADTPETGEAGGVA